MANHFEPAERGLRDHVALWRRRAAIILGVAAVALAAGLVMALIPPKQYQATATVLFPVEPAGQPGQDSGGYTMPAPWVNIVQRTQASHLPDPPEKTPVEQGISVHYSHLVWGGISFALL